MLALELVVDGLDIRRHVVGGLIPVVGLLGQRPLEHRVQRRRITGDHGLQWIVGFVKNLLQDRDIVAGKGKAAGEYPIKHHTDRPDIGSSIGGLAQQSFRRDVMKGSDDHAGLGVAGKVLQAGDAEVDDLDVAIGLEHDVGRLDVAVHHAHAVRIAETEAELVNHVQLFNQGELAAGLEQILQRIAADEFHDDVGKAVLLAES